MMIMAITAIGTSDLMKGLASLAWPVVALVALVLFRGEVGGLIKRIRKAKVFGQDIELDESLNSLEKQAEEFAQAEVPVVITTRPSEQQDTTITPGYIEAEINEVLQLTSTSSKAALMQLASVIEREARRFLAASGNLGKVRLGSSLQQTAEVLERTTDMPRGSLEAFKSFSKVRNEIIHGHGNVTDDETLRAIDSGIVLLRSLAAVPRELNVVYSPGVKIYSDDKLQHELLGRGVMLETTSPGGAVTTFRIFPSTRTHFYKGMEVTWEWNMGMTWKDAWYKDPDSGKVKLAWNSSAEFIGRDLRDI
jgi:hypothetical protein